MTIGKICKANLPKSEVLISTAEAWAKAPERQVPTKFTSARGVIPSREIDLTRTNVNGQRTERT